MGQQGRVRVRHTEIDEAMDEIEEEIASKQGKLEKKVDKKKEDKDKDEELEKIAPPVIQIDGYGVMRLYQVNSLLKEFELQEKRGELVPKFGISINKGFTASVATPNVDIFVWYETELERDKVYKNILNALQVCGVIIFNV